MEIKEPPKRILPINVMLNFTATAAGQSVDTIVECPFKIGKIVFQPPQVQIAANLTYHYLLSSDIADGSVIGFVNGFLLGAKGSPITRTYTNPLNLTGVHRFQLRSFNEITTGTQTAVAAGVWIVLECHEA